ncbi:hypothetical protein ASD35_03510 [Pelomonas sp. Root1444]|nr:hypothetical protein ASD35_03510 [Pelomonas sp. Root1444]
MSQGARSILADVATAAAYGHPSKNAAAALQRDDLPAEELTRDALRRSRLLSRRLAALDGPPLAQSAEDPEGVQALVNVSLGLPKTYLARLAAEFVPVVLQQKLPPRVALEFLRPVPRDLLFRARQMQCEVRESKFRKLHTGSLPAGVDSWPGSQALLSTVQHLSAHYTAEWSPDGRRGVNHALLEALSWHPPSRNLGLEVQSIFRSIAVLQSTYDDSVLAGARKLVEEAVAWVNRANWKHIRIELVAEAADYLTVGWPCPACMVRLRTEPNVHRQLPPYRRSCRCTAMRWCWSDTPPHPLAQQLRRAQHRCRLWAVLSGLGVTQKLNVFEVLDAVQQDVNAVWRVQQTQRNFKDAARARWSRLTAAQPSNAAEAHRVSQVETTLEREVPDGF